MKRRPLLAAGLAAGLPAAAVRAGPLRSDSPRLVSIGSALTEIVYAVGAESQLVGVDSTSLYPAAARALPQVGYMRALSAEGVLALRPTVILATTAAGPKETLEQLERTGVELVVLPDHYDWESVVAKIAAVGHVTGREAEATRLADAGQAEMAALSRRLAGVTSRPRVLFLLSMSGGAPQAAGHGTAADGIIRLAGGVNAMDGYGGYKPLTPEAVIAARPDFVLVTRQTVEALGSVQAVLEQPGLARTPAGRGGRVLQFDALLLLGFGPRTPQAARALAADLHPDRAGPR